jgi:hypothetical protein
MNAQIHINGNRYDIPCSEDTSLSEAIRYVENKMLNNQILVTSIRVDGVELTERERNELAEIPIRALGDLEILTASPREIADDTIQSLIPYVASLSELSRTIVDSEKGIYNEEMFRKLLDGLELMADAVNTVKRALKVGPIDEISEAEDELALQLSLILDARRSNDIQTAQKLMTNDLPRVLNHWSEVALPALASYRDN